MLPIVLRLQYAYIRLGTPLNPLQHYGLHHGGGVRARGAGVRDARVSGSAALAAPLLRDHLRRAHLLLCALTAALVRTSKPNLMVFRFEVIQTQHSSLKET